MITGLPVHFEYKNDIQCPQASFTLRILNGISRFQFGMSFANQLGAGIVLTAQNETHRTFGPKGGGDVLHGKAIGSALSQGGHHMIPTHIHDALFRLVDSHPDSVFIKDRNLRYVYGNQAYLNCNNVTLEELQGRTSLEVHPPETAEKCHRMDARALKLGHPTVIEDTFELRGRDFQRAEVTLSVCRDADGEITHLMGVARDVKQRYQTELNAHARAAYLSGADKRRLRRVCSWCQKMHVADGEWEVVQTDPVHKCDDNYLTHGFCEGCANTYLEINMSERTTQPV